MRQSRENGVKDGWTDGRTGRAESVRPSGRARGPKRNLISFRRNYKPKAGLGTLLIIVTDKQKITLIKLE